MLLHLHDYLIRAIARQELTCLCLLDLSAAFDTIDHQILLDRLKQWFGIEGSALSWFQSYLQSRTFSVFARGTMSSPSIATFGVPQGSVLGPLLFIMYTTPLSSLISTLSVDHHLYADDTQLFISFSPKNFVQSAQNLQNAFNSVGQWMTSNLLTLNPSKTEFLVIGNQIQLAKLTDPSLLLADGTLIKCVPTARNLGIVFDSHLSFHDQITQLTKACFFHIRDLRRIRSCLDHKTASLIATSIVHSKLDYCNSLYMNLPNYELDRLQYIQNSLARAVCRTPRFTHITPVLHSLHWLKIRERITYKIISLTFKALQTSQPTYLAAMVTLSVNNRTRSSKLVTLQRPPALRRKIIDRSFFHEAPRIWNSLPASLRKPSDTVSGSGPLSMTLDRFHTMLKTHLFSLSYPDYVACDPT